MDPLPAHPPSLLDPQLLWATVALIATLLLAAVVFAWLDRWRKRADREPVTPADQLTAFRQSYDRGELSQEEYEQIRAKLAPKLRQQLNLPPKPAGPTGDRQSPSASEATDPRLHPGLDGSPPEPPPQTDDRMSD